MYGIKYINFDEFRKAENELKEATERYNVFNADFEAGKYDNLDDESFDKLQESFSLYPYKMRVYDTQVKTIRPNEWLKSFLNSFGICENKRISEKQKCVFMKYMKTNPLYGSHSETYSFHYDGIIYEIDRYGLLTVRKKF